MDFVSMFDVMPVSGTWRNEGRFCAICALGGAPAMFAFLSPEAMREPGVLANIQQISNRAAELQVVVVCTGTPSDALKTEMCDLAKSEKLTIPLVLLPTGELPASLPISPKADKSVLMYKDQKIYKSFDRVDFATFAPLGENTKAAEGASLESSDASLETSDASLYGAGASLEGVGASLESRGVPTERDVMGAAFDMLAGLSPPSDRNA